MPARRQKVVGVLMVSKVRLVFVLLLAGVVVRWSGIRLLSFVMKIQETRRGKRERIMSVVIGHSGS